MRSLFQMGIQHPRKTFLGQWDLLSTLVNSVVAVYRIRTEEEMAKDRLDLQKDLAAQAAAREAEALRIQQEAIKALQPKPTTTTTPAASSGTILGMKPVTFYIVAGATAGALVLGTMLLTKGK